jgi:hypothetical protein
MKATIGKIAALQAVATDPGHSLTLCRSLLRWVKVGLTVKYGNIPEKYRKQLDRLRDLWDDAENSYGSSSEAWPIAMIMCADVADECSIIAGYEDLMDYKEFDFNLTNAYLSPPVPTDQGAGQKEEGSHASGM